MVGKINLNKMKKSFTLIEVILVIGILAFILGLTIPFLMDFNSSQNLDETTEEIISVLRKAQSKSIAGEKDSSWGVNFSQPFQYILFRENFNPGSPENEIYEYSKNINLTSNFPEVKFEKLTGRIDNQFEIVLTSGNKKNKIFVNREGTIDYYQ